MIDSSMRSVKVIVYPIFGVFQFFLAWKHGYPGAILFCFTGFALIGLAVLHLRRLLSTQNATTPQKEAAKGTHD